MITCFSFLYDIFLINAVVFVVLFMSARTILYCENMARIRIKECIKEEVSKLSEINNKLIETNEKLLARLKQAK